MHVDVVRTLNDLQALKRNWDTLHEADPDAHYFLSSTWISSWFAARSLPWQVLAVKENPQDETYVAFFPIQIGVGLDKGMGFYNTIVMGGSYYAVYTGILCDPAFQDRAIPALAEHIRGLNWKRLHLDDVYMSPERLQLFRDCFSSSDVSSGKMARGEHVTAAGEDIDHDVYIYVPLPDDFEQFLESKLGARTRRNVRLCLRRLDSGDEFRVTHADAETIKSDLETFYELWERQWKPTNPRYAAYTIDCSRQMLLQCFQDGSLLLPILWHGDRPVAAFVIFLDRHRNSLICFLGSRDVSFGNPSPGVMLHADNIRWAIRNGFGTYDLGTGNYAYKYMFGSHEHRIERFRIATKTGRNLGERLDPFSLPVVLSRARQLADEGDIVNAVIACRQILAVDPLQDEALALYREIVAKPVAEESEGSSDDARLEMAFGLHRAGDLTEAERQYRAVLADNPNSYDAAHQLGILFLQRGEAKAAEAEIRRALEIRPEAASAHCNYGNVLAAVRNFEGAIAAYDQAVDLEPRHAIAFNNRGNALRRAGRLDEALSSYERAIALQPTYRQALDNRLALLSQMEEEAEKQVPEAAVKEAEEVQEV
jgi:CelD/BcsL family acetyltransferase involved in cellulose biosynthesis